MRYETVSVVVDDIVPSNSAGETVSVQSDSRQAVSSKAVIRNLFGSLEQKGVRYCHWKSNIRLEETLAAAEDIDLLVAQFRVGLDAIPAQPADADAIVGEAQQAFRRHVELFEQLAG